MNNRKHSDEERAAFRAAAAQVMRYNMTSEEETIFQWLKDRGFEAQVPLFSPRYRLGIVADFYNRKRNIRIEIDGPQHQTTPDQRQDRKLKTDLGVTTLRFTNQQIREELPLVLETLTKLLD